MNRILNIAHRGASGIYPENTMLAFNKAIEIGCDGIETDVQLTKDNIPVLFHDERIDNLTNGTGLLKDYTYSELLEFEIIKNKDERYPKQKIPRLEQLLELIKDKQITLCLELKNNIEHYHKIEEIVCEKLAEYNLIEQTVISSYNHFSLRKINKMNPEIELGLLYWCMLYKPENYADSLGIELESLHPDFNSLNHEVVKGIKKAGYKICTYTVNQKKDIKRMIDLGVDGIITDYPGRLAKILR